MKEILADQPLTKREGQIICETILENFPEPHPVEDRRSQRSLNDVRINFKRLMQAIEKGEQIPWHKICEVKNRLLKIVQYYFSPQDRIRINELIRECQEKIRVQDDTPIVSSVKIESPQNFHIPASEPPPGISHVNFLQIDGHQIVWVDEKMCRTMDLIQRIAEENISVMLTGESGTGKEMLARAIHYFSPRKDKPFCALNCAAIPAELMESELFGHKKGSFTGAIKDTTGLLKEVDGGTLFLDEIGEMPMPLQAKLLRVLDQRTFSPVGALNEKQRFTGRLIAATNRNLQDEMSQDHFRPDIYYRLAEFPIHIPALHDRPADLEILIEFFLKKIDRQLECTPEVVNFLKKYHFTGNIRELKNVIYQLYIEATRINRKNRLICTEHLGVIGLGNKQIEPARERLEAEMHSLGKQIKELLQINESQQNQINALQEKIADIQSKTQNEQKEKTAKKRREPDIQKNPWHFVSQSKKAL